MVEHLQTSWKAFLAFLAVAAAVLGIQYTDLSWWVWFIEAVLTGFVVYWKKNRAGTFTQPEKDEAF